MATPIEQLLKSAYTSTLGLEKVEVDESFFDLGGDSLSGILLCLQLSHELGIELSLVELYYNPTIRDLAQVLETMARRNARTDT